ncbi:hypothetical protein LMG28138_02736 [Pararobbsia alpina]|uniref:Uncharacterized protein n=1 Tax=Pararobbsia alpina TaxID=621374 RepID=A0A6S7B888_9BURK|nr:hypothetical protein LMG28138_02736 [Pararobbsia alpina]
MERKSHDQGVRIEPAGSGSNWSTLRTLFVELLAYHACSA